MRGESAETKVDRCGKIVLDFVSVFGSLNGNPRSDGTTTTRHVMNSPRPNDFPH
jgi:hypothetical protein